MSILHQLKHNPLTSYMPVVLFTGADPSAKKAPAFRLGANAFVSKPVELDRLHDVMLTGWSWPPLWAPPPLA